MFHHNTFKQYVFCLHISNTEPMNCNFLLISSIERLAVSQSQLFLELETEGSTHSLLPFDKNIINCDRVLEFRCHLA